MDWPSVHFSSVQSLSCVRLFATPWAAACQASLSITNSWSLLKLLAFESVMPSNHLISVVPFSCLQSFPASGSFPMSQFFASGGQSTGASASVLTVSIQGWFPLGLIGLISLLSKGLSRVFFSPGGSFSSLDCLLAPKDLHPSHIKIYHPFPTSSKVSTYYNINVQSKISLHIYQFDSPKPLY